TGRNSIAESSDYDHGDIFVYNLEDGDMNRYELPGFQSEVAISGKNIFFRDNRYGQLTAMVHLMNIETGETWQIGDEEKGVYLSPDISGDKIVYKFDEDFGSFLKDSAPQLLLMTDISSNETTIIASPGERIKGGPKIDSDNIVWGDKRNGIYYSVWFYNVNEGKEVFIADTNEEYGTEVDISGDTVIWTDIVDGKDVLKLIRLDIPENSAYVTGAQQTPELEKSTTENDPGESTIKPAGLYSEITFAAIIFGLCIFAMRTINYKK
ncbi:MAG: hypothetical protein PHI15_10400, partial [Methanomicrobium sp.]|nr:hypothetical protein [Methanomicrobium sp.]